MECRDWLNGVRATDRLHSWLRKAEVLNLALLNQFLHRTRHIFDRHFWINTVLIEQIDDVRPESFQRSFGNFLDVLRPAVHDR